METRIKQLIRKLNVYFDCKVIGSYLFLEEGYLTLEEINDVDIMVSDLQVMKKVVSFLKDNGFEETGIFKTNFRDRYGHFSQGSLIFKSDSYELPIHLLLSKTDPPAVWELSKIISNKWQNRSESDLIQLKLIIERTKTQ